MKSPRRKKPMRVIDALSPSPFETWFKAQFGELPHAGRHASLVSRVNAAEVELAVAQAELAAENRLGELWDGARKAWGLTDRDKRKRRW